MLVSPRNEKVALVACNPCGYRFTIFVGEDRTRQGERLIRLMISSIL
jgi:hypothetical protein